MLVYLDKNKLTLFQTSQNELYDLMLQVASHTLFGRPSKRVRRPKRPPHSDREVEKIAAWLRSRAERVSRGERQITYRELRRILNRFGYLLVRPKGNSIEIVRPVEETQGLFRRRTAIVEKHIDTIGWSGEDREMAISDVKKVRRICRLREEDGIDSNAFYDETAVIDSFVNSYRTLLRRLARV
jgi:death-on-curing protein